MALFQFKSKGVTRKLVDLVYPVGSLYFSTNSTNPSTLFGGTWQPYAQGRCLIGAGQGNDGTTSMSFTTGTTGGEYKHKLTKEELAPHQHPTNNFVINTTGGNLITVGSGSERLSYWTNGNAKTDLSTGGQAHNNLQPYIVTYIFRRTA